MPSTASTCCTVVGLVANHLKPGMFHKAQHVGDAASGRWRRRSISNCSHAWHARCLGRTGAFDCSAMDWFLERAQALGVEHQPPVPLLLGRHVLALRLAAGPQVGEIQTGLREAARRRGRHR